MILLKCFKYYFVKVDTPKYYYIVKYNLFFLIIIIMVGTKSRAPGLLLLFELLYHTSGKRKTHWLKIVRRTSCLILGMYLYADTRCFVVESTVLYFIINTYHRVRNLNHVFLFLFIVTLISILTTYILSHIYMIVLIKVLLYRMEWFKII